jgi:hypothetical protein
VLVEVYVAVALSQLVLQVVFEFFGARQTEWIVGVLE